MKEYVIGLERWSGPEGDQSAFMLARIEMQLAAERIGLTLHTIDGDRVIGHPETDIELFCVSNRDTPTDRPYPPVVIATPRGLPFSMDMRQARPDGFSFYVYPSDHPMRHAVFITAKHMGIIPEKGFAAQWGTQVDYRYDGKPAHGNMVILEEGSIASHIPHTADVWPQLYIVFLGMYGQTNVDYREIAAIASVTSPRTLVEDAVEEAASLTSGHDDLFIALQKKERRRKKTVESGTRISHDTQALLAYLLGTTHTLDADVARHALDEILGSGVQIDDRLMSLREDFLADLVRKNQQE